MKRPTRGPQWELVRLLLIIGQVFGTLIAVGAIAIAVFADHAQGLVDVGRLDPLPPSLLRVVDGVDPTWTGTADIQISDAPLWLRLLTAAPAVVLTAAVALVSTHLIDILRRVRTGYPFDPQTPVLLARISRTILVAALVGPLLAGLASMAMLDRATGGEVTSFTLPISTMVGWILAGLVVEVIATAFHHGLRLTEDTEGLV